MDQNRLARIGDPAVAALLPLQARSARAFVLREGLAVRAGRLVLFDLAALAARMRAPGNTAPESNKPTHA